MTDHVFDRAIALTQSAQGTWTGQSSPDYANMVGAYGGIVAATPLNSVLSDNRHTGTPVSQTVNFCTGLGAGASCVETKLQRAGKYTRHWNTELTRGDTIIATSSIVMGARGETLGHQPAPAPDVPAASDIDPMDNVIPLEWTRRYDYRVVNGGTENYCFFLRMIQVRGKMKPMGTVTLATHFIATRDDLAAQGTDHLLGVVDMNRAQNQFHDQAMQLFSPDGKILASGTQLVWYRQ